MSRLTPMDLAFLVLENSSRQMHMCAYQMFKIPARQKQSFVEKVLKTYRSGEVIAPFNQKLKWLGKNVASWQRAQPDLEYHVRHLAVPAPGTLKQFYEIVTFLNTPLLDRDKPLWECYIIDGIEGNHCAVMIKVHHALIDGGGALKMFRNAMNDSAKDKSIRAIWNPSKKDKPRKERSRVSEPQLKKLLSGFGSLPSGVRSAGTEFARMGAQALGFKPGKSAIPFGAKRTIFNNTAQSSARRYANCELSLAQVKTMAKKSGTTVNDIITTVIDDALHHYLRDHGEAIDVPLVSLMAMSIRKEGQAASGNQAIVELVPMGAPKASVDKRLQQIHDSIQHVKNKGGKLPVSVRQFYSLFIFGSATLPDFSSTFQKIPSANLVISNMVGPQEQLYMGGVPMVAFQGLPIVPPGGGLNVTFASLNNVISLALGAAPEAVNEPYKLIEFIEQSFDTLQKCIIKPKPAAKRKAKKS